MPQRTLPRRAPLLLALAVLAAPPASRAAAAQPPAPDARVRITVAGARGVAAVATVRF